MPRPPTKGLRYFPKDVHFYDDLKIIDLLNEYGALGVTVYDVLLCLVFQEGYYIEWPLEKIALLIIRIIGNRWIEDSNVVQQIINYCANINLLDKDLLQKGIITSAGIQRRYNEVTARNKVKKDKYWLLNDEKKPVSATKTPVSATKIQQIKENKIKEKEKNNISSEQSEISSESGIKLILQNGSFYNVKKDEFDLWIQKYQPVDVRNELTKMRDWFVSNEKKRKTQDELIPFINRWLAKAKSKLTSTAKSAGKRKPDYSDPDYYSAEKDGDINDVFT